MGFLQWALHILLRASTRPTVMTLLENMSAILLANMVTTIMSAILWTGQILM